MSKSARAVLAVSLLLLLAGRLVAIERVAVNWDEFALLAHARRTAESGVLHSAGRPGLAVLLLVPFAAGCENEIETVRRARLLWLGLTLAFLAGLFVLLARMQRDPRRRWIDAGAGVALLAAVPAFLEWSLQVRSDQIALAAGCWGGVALLASRRRPAWAPVAGLLFGLGFLATQKLVYVAALMGLLAAGDLFLRREWRTRRDLSRALACGALASLVVAGYRLLTQQRFEAPPRTAEVTTGLVVREGLAAFDFYRHTLGWSQYAEMLPTLAPHLLLGAAVVAAAWVAVRRGLAGGEKLALAGAVLALGLAVGRFHAGAFAYFWMTLGLFPAVAFSLAGDPLRAWTAPWPARVRRLAVTGLAALLALPALMQLGFHLGDTQSVQARSFELVHANFRPGDAGFQPESALFCRADPDPFQTYFSYQIYRQFGGEDRDWYTRRMIRRFEEKPVKFMLDSWRLRQFPPELRRYWQENYQPYRDAVRVAGRRIAGARGEHTEFDLKLAGHYRWLPATGPQAIEIDDVVVPAGHVIELSRGPHRAVLRDDVPHGMLVLALDDPPGPAEKRFYKAY